MGRGLGFLQGPGDLILADLSLPSWVLLHPAPYPGSQPGHCREVFRSRGHTAQVCSCSGSSMCILWPWADCRGQEAQLFYPWNVDRGSNPLLRITVQIRWAAPFREPSLESLLRHHIIPSCVFSLLLSPAHYFSSNASSHYSSRYWFSSSSATCYLDHSFWLPPC